jgi:hypothetical protein
MLEPAYGGEDGIEQCNCFSGKWRWGRPCSIELLLSGLLEYILPGECEEAFWGGIDCEGFGDMERGRRVEMERALHAVLG